MSWIWVRRDVLLAIHSEQLAEHGGAEALRDEGLLESALARPKNMAEYDEADIYALAAAYAFGVIRNHPFMDGNKRTGLIAAILFLELNGFSFSAPEAEAAEMTLKAAAGEISEDDYAHWLKTSCV